MLSRIEGIHSSVGSSKEEICARIGAAALIDDDLRHLADVSTEALLRVLLQDGRPDAPVLPPGITFCGSWTEVLDLLP